MQSEIQEIQSLLNSYFGPELINDVILPDFLLDPRTEEDINDRFYLIYHKLCGPLCITMQETLKRKLTNTEIGFISERLQAFLKEQGF
jgi:hypothetical protein